MACRLLDGKKIAKKIAYSLKREIISLAARGKIKLVVLAISGNPSSEVYINAQRKLAASLGIEYHIKKYPASVTQAELEKDMDRLNCDDSVTGIMVETPLPKTLKPEQLFQAIDPRKDAEGLNPATTGKVVYEKWRVAPCTASACFYLIESIGAKLEGKEVVIVGHSSVVGKPLALMLLSKLATVTVCHIGTYRRGLLEKHVKRAEILVVAVGKSALIKGNWIKRGAIVIDVGINAKNGVITGDVEFDKAKKRAAYITPVPGGVGPVTTAMLMKNLVELYKNQRKEQ
ncbi:MAG: bifunctional 5,10-methylenetetrahydrofolate dehydrogenase/5,10-methenyltetrahydrofolate cyclohydrolase [Candidatus Omnitrophota bacterium]